ncbi:MAG: hypothetical protein WC472_01670 [Candidatus Paceibacterota bacterium]
MLITNPIIGIDGASLNISEIGSFKLKLYPVDLAKLSMQIKRVLSKTSLRA